MSTSTSAFCVSPSSIHYGQFPVRSLSVEYPSYVPSQYAPFRALCSTQSLLDNQKYPCVSNPPICPQHVVSTLPSLAQLNTMSIGDIPYSSSSTSPLVGPLRPSCCSSSSISTNLTDAPDPDLEKDTVNMKINTDEGYSHVTNDNTKSTTSLLPILDYEFNAREICKQCILLEDHLVHPEKRCGDCCVKHFLALEGLAEEALTLDHQGQIPSHSRYRILQSLPSHIRSLQRSYYSHPHDAQNCFQIAQDLRKLRKQLQGASFGFIFNKRAHSYRPLEIPSHDIQPSLHCESGMCDVI